MQDMTQDLGCFFATIMWCKSGKKTKRQDPWGQGNAKSRNRNTPTNTNYHGTPRRLGPTMRPRAEKDKTPKNRKSNTPTNVRCNARLGMLFATIMRYKSGKSNMPTNARRNAILGLLLRQSWGARAKKGKTPRPVKHQGNAKSKNRNTPTNTSYHTRPRRLWGNHEANSRKGQNAKKCQMSPRFITLN
jgi:hypothetical protein